MLIIMLIFIYHNSQSYDTDKLMHTTQLFIFSTILLFPVEFMFQYEQIPNNVFVNVLFLC